MGKVELIWKDNSSDETGFVIRRKVLTYGASSYSTVGEVGGNITSYTDNTVSRGITYCYRVKAKRGGIASFISNTASVTVR